MPVVALAFEFDFHGGSMGYAVGAVQSSGDRRFGGEAAPYLFLRIRWCQKAEALISLMQMAKTSAAIERLKGQGILYISVLTDPIYGGVSGLALLGDINIAELTPALVSRAEHH